MTNIIEITTNKLLNEIVEEAVRQAVRQQSNANKEYDKQKELEQTGKPFNFTQKHLMEEGSHACCQILQTIFGGYPYQHFAAIEKIVNENKSDILGYDCQDYVTLFVEAYEAIRK